jgi:hypothetical protein
VHKTSIGGALSIFAALAVQNEDPAHAARLFGAIRAIYDRHAYKAEKADTKFNDLYIGKARIALGDKDFDKAFEEGRALSSSEAVALARQGETDRTAGLIGVQ